MSGVAIPCDDDDDHGCTDDEEEVHGLIPVKNDQAQLWKSLCDADECERLRDGDYCHSNDDASDRDDDALEAASFLLPNQQRLLEYNSFLQKQRYYDDLKHVDYRFIDFGTIMTMNSLESAPLPQCLSPLIIEQDKALGKGGFCWDAAFILGEYIASQWPLKRSEVNDSNKTTLVELGCGTGLCGLYIAQCLRSKAAGTIAIHLTDMDGPIQTLLQRNVRRTMDHVYENELQGYLAKQYPSWNNPSAGVDINFSDSATVDAFVLDWDDFANPSQDSHSYDTYDVVFGSDVVATLYNPIHLANTIHCLCHDQSTMYISFKERLSSIHDEFHAQIQNLFRRVNIIPTQDISRNRNPDVYILIAQQKIEGRSSS